MENKAENIINNWNNYRAACQEREDLCKQYAELQASASKIHEEYIKKNEEVKRLLNKYLEEN